MTEDLHQMSKAKPMVLGSGLIWFAIFINYSLEFGAAKNVAAAFQHNLTVGLLMGYITLAIGKDNPEFLGLAGLNAVVAANAGGISTFFVWQQNMLHFTRFFNLTIPCIVNFLAPACIMHFSVSKEAPNFVKEIPVLKRGSKRVYLIFIFTFPITILINVILDIPAIAGMMFGLTLLRIFSVLNMHPPFSMEQWLLLTLTLGVGGSLLAIGSAPALDVFCSINLL